MAGAGSAVAKYPKIGFNEATFAIFLRSYARVFWGIWIYFPEYQTNLLKQFALAQPPEGLNEALLSVETRKREAGRHCEETT